MTANNSVCTKKSKPIEKSNDEPGRPPKVVKRKITKSVVKRVWIEELTLFEKTITRVYEISYIRDDKTGKEEKIRRLKDCNEKCKEYHLKSVEKTDLAALRNSKKPIFIVKEDDKYYYTEIHYTMSFYGTLNVEHKCAPRKGVCKHLNPNSDECSGCAKVRNQNPHIENYDWITKAYEAVNNKYEAFVVLECKHHELELETYTPVTRKNKENLQRKGECKRKSGNMDSYRESNWNWFPEVDF